MSAVESWLVVVDSNMTTSRIILSDSPNGAAATFAIGLVNGLDDLPLTVRVYRLDDCGDFRVEAITTATYVPPPPEVAP